MNRRKQILVLQMLCAFMFGIIVTMFVNTNSILKNMAKNTTEEISNEKVVMSIYEYADAKEAEVKILAETGATKHVVANNKAIQVETEIVNTTSKSTVVSKILCFRSKASTLLDKIIAIEPRYLQSYLNELLDTKHIEDVVTKQIHHMSVALQRDRRICYVSNFINEAHMDDVVWRYVKGAYSTDSSP